MRGSPCGPFRWGVAVGRAGCWGRGRDRGGGTRREGRRERGRPLERLVRGQRRRPLSRVRRLHGGLRRRDPCRPTRRRFGRSLRGVVRRRDYLSMENAGYN
jgi:hypothetical protein